MHTPEQVQLDGKSLCDAWVVQTNRVAQAIAHGRPEELTPDDVALLHALSTTMLTMASEQRRMERAKRRGSGLLMPGLVPG